MSPIDLVKKISILFVLCSLLFTCVIPSFSARQDREGYQMHTIEYTEIIPQPTIQESEGILCVSLNGVETYILDASKPMMPEVVKTFELPWGAHLLTVEILPGNIETISITSPVRPAPLLESTGAVITPVTDVYDSKTYQSNTPYPESWYRITKGTGMNKQGDRVLHVAVHLYPVRYIPSENLLEYVQEFSFSLTYEFPEDQILSTATPYDLLVITPASYTALLQELVTHKNNYNVQTMMITLENIYSIFPGRDHEEQIKYCIKNYIELYDIQYVLLIGDMKTLPIRSVDSYPWGDDFGGDILSDLYYADIYDENFSFCSWDSNDNDIFGEINFNQSGPGHITNMGDIDGVDLYPDVGIGRLACVDENELQIMIQKIIIYEETTYDQTWFNTFILAGGDTFPPSKGSPFFIYEGEITNTKVAQQLPEFTHKFLWSSKYNLNAITFNRAINKGAGFLSYAGHGFEHGWGTYRPNALQNRMGITHPLYYTPFLNFLKNEYKLPVIFFDACLTAKLDFNISDLQRYYPMGYKLFLLATGQPDDPMNFYPCFAWSFLKHTQGGGIAAVGATRPAFTMVDENGVYAGAGYLDVHFFKAYEEGVTVSQMLTQAQIDYLNNVGKDFFTIEEYILLGDPSLRVGGYP